MGSPRDLRGFGSCERQVRRREPAEPEYVNSFHREVVRADGLMRYDMAAQ